MLSKEIEARVTKESKACSIPIGREGTVRSGDCNWSVISPNIKSNLRDLMNY